MTTSHVVIAVLEAAAAASLVAWIVVRYLRWRRETNARIAQLRGGGATLLAAPTVEEATVRVATGAGARRFRVLRSQGGTVYQAYPRAGQDGTDGTAARQAWERYQQSALRGEFWFYDGESCRGHFIR
jgi:hypothetical protein